MRVVIIGATGHVGGYLVPRLIEAGHDVVAISRGLQDPYRGDPAWQRVERVVADRAADDVAGTFGDRIRRLAADAVIDMVCFTPASAAQLLDALRGTGTRLLMCGTIWTHGTLTAVPAAEHEDREPWGEYGVGKAAIEDLILAEATRPDGVPAAILHPGHISGPGWPVITPAGNLDPGVWRALATGEPLVLPNQGLETVHHVHADDVAQAFQLALERPEGATGRAFHVVSDRAVTLRGFAEQAAGWWGRTAQLRYVPLADFAGPTHDDTAATRAHVERSHAVSIAAAREHLGYRPRYSSVEATREAVQWLSSHGDVGIPAPIA